MASWAWTGILVFPGVSVLSPVLRLLSRKWLVMTVQLLIQGVILILICHNSQCANVSVEMIDRIHGRWPGSES